MRKFAAILIFAATAVVSQPSFASNEKAHAPAKVEQSSDVVVFGSKRGQDPDPFIRYQINRDFQAAH